MQVVTIDDELMTEKEEKNTNISVKAIHISTLS